MKKLLFALLACGALMNTSCSKNDSNNASNNSGNNGSLNATEQKLIGTWFLKKERRIMNPNTTFSTDTTINTFPLKPYLTFTAKKHSGAGSVYNSAAKIMTDKASAGERGSNSLECIWYFDEVSNSLIMGPLSSNYPYLYVDQNRMIVAGSMPSNAVIDTLWFEK